MDLGRGMIRHAGVLFVLGAVAACTPAYTGVVDARGYRDERFELTVTALDDGRLLPADWRLDNLYARSGSGKLEPNMASSWRRWPARLWSRARKRARPMAPWL